MDGLPHRSSLRRKSMQVGKSLTHSVGGYLPNTLTEMWEPSRDFAFLRLPTSGARCIVALSGWVHDFPLAMGKLAYSSIRCCRTLPHVMVISSEGYFYSYNIDLENGGECSLMKQYRFVLSVPPLLPFTQNSLLQFARLRRGIFKYD